MSDDLGENRAVRLAELQEQLSRSWETGEQASVEAFLEHHAWLRDDSAATLELVYHEMLLRQDCGEPPPLAEFIRRFPVHAQALKRFFAIQQMAEPAPPGPLAAAGAASGPSGRANAAKSTKHGNGAETRRQEDARLAEHGRSEHGPLPPAPEGYELLAEIGRGGMGVVYRARQRNLNRLVALKMILAGPYADPAALTRFRAEAEAVARLQHPHIVQIFEMGELEGHPFLVMEYVAGGSLAARTHGVPQPPREAAQLLERLARAMHTVHERGIVHRDLKPGNVLLATGAEVPLCQTIPKIADFGLAKFVGEESPSATASRDVLGTPLYMSPEQAAGQSKDVGPSADVYALGAIFYGLLTGQPPFKGATSVDILMQIRNNDPVAPRRLVPAVPHDLDTICLKCLQKEPQKRYASAAELADDLGRHLAGQPIHARPIGGWERAVKWARREPRVAGLIVLVSLVTLVGLATTFGLWRIAERRADAEARQRRQTEQQLCLFRIGLVDRELQAGRVAWAVEQLELCPEYLRRWEWYYLKRRCDANDPQQASAEHPRGLSGVAFSTDGKRLATGCGDGIVRIWDPGNIASPLRELEGHRGSVLGVAFSPRGDWLASAGEDHQVVVWDAQTGEKERVFSEHQSRVACAVFAPRGDEIASATFNQNGPAEILVWNRHTGRVRLTLPGHTQRATSLASSPDGTRLYTASHDQTVRVWDTASGKSVRVFADHAFPVSGVTVSPDGKLVASAAGRLQADRPEEGEVLVWEASTGQIVHRLQGHRGRPVALAFSPDGQRLATAGWDAEIKLWDVASGQEVLALRGHTDGIMGLAFSPDGTLLASASVDRTLRIWSANQGDADRSAER